MRFEDCFAVWDKLTPEQQAAVRAGTVLRSVKKGELVHNGSEACTGVVLVKTGRLRAYYASEDGREITLYRLFEQDLCMLTAPCMMRSIQFDIVVRAEKDSEVWIIAPYVYKRLMEGSAAAANYSNEIMATRLSEVMWLMEQIMWRSLDKRVAAFLLEEAAIEETPLLKLTHETVANHLGTQREVITRMLRYFQEEGTVRLTRGTVELLDVTKLKALRDA